MTPWDIARWVAVAFKRIFKSISNFIAVVRLAPIPIPATVNEEMLLDCLNGIIETKKVKLREFNIRLEQRFDEFDFVDNVVNRLKVYHDSDTHSSCWRFLQLSMVKINPATRSEERDFEQSIPGAHQEESTRLNEYSGDLSPTSGVVDTGNFDAPLVEESTAHSSSFESTDFRTIVSRPIKIHK